MVNVSDSKDYKVIGSNTIRHVGYDKVTGRAIYGADIKLPGLIWASIIRSPHAHAVIKNVGECFCKSYQQEFNLDYTIFRFFNTFGPKQSDDFVVSKFIEAALNEKDITIYGDGSQTRTLCFIDDHIQATMNAFSQEYHDDIILLNTNLPILAM